MEALSRVVTDSRVQRIACPLVAAPRGHYSIATECGGLVFVSGLLPINAATQGDASAANHVPGFAEQAEQVLKNLLAVLDSAGSDPAHVLKVTAYIVGAEHWAAFDSVFSRHFAGYKPARAVIPVHEFHNGYLVEVEAVAVTTTSASKR